MVYLCYKLNRFSVEKLNLSSLASLLTKDLLKQSLPKVWDFLLESLISSQWMVENIYKGPNVGMI